MVLKHGFAQIGHFKSKKSVINHYGAKEASSIHTDAIYLLQIKQEVFVKHVQCMPTKA